MTDPETLHLQTSALKEDQQANLHSLEDALYRHWDLGKNIVLNWCPRENGVDVPVVPNYLPVTLLFAPFLFLLLLELPESLYWMTGTLIIAVSVTTALCHWESTRSR